MKHIPKVKVLAHGVDPDGIISHALLRRYHQDHTEVSHQYLDYADLFPVLFDMSRKPSTRSLVYMADLNYTQDLVDYPCVMRRIKGANAKVAWFDHHTGSVANREKISENCYPTIVNKYSCSARIISEQFLANPRDEYARFISHVAFVHDFAHQEELYDLGEQLQDIIKLRELQDKPNKQLDHLVERLARGTVFKKDGKLYKSFYHEAMACRQLKDIAREELVERATEHQVNGLTLMASFADDILYMKPAPEHLRSTFQIADLFLTVFGKDNRSTMLFANPKTFQPGAVARICNSLGGGGRGHGGGFVLGYKVTDDNYTSTRDKIIERIGKYLINNPNH